MSTLSNVIGMIADHPTPKIQIGGVIVLAAFEGNGTRPSHMGIGINDGKVMYTLNSTEVHGVVYELPRK